MNYYKKGNVILYFIPKPSQVTLKLIALKASTRSSNSLLRNSRGNILSNILAIIRMPLHQGGNIELGLLNHLHLTDVAILNGEDGGGLTLDFLTGSSGDESLDQSLEVSLSGECGHGVDHLGTNLLGLSRLGITRLLKLIILLLGESNAEHADDVSVGGTAVDIGLNDGLLLLDQGAELVAGHVHAVEVEKAVESLNIFDAELDLAVAHGFVVVQISEGEFNDTSFEVFGCDFGTLGFGDDGFTAVLLGEDGGSNELVPFFLEEGVDGLLLSSLLGLCETLVLALLMRGEMGLVIV